MPGVPGGRLAQLVSMHFVMVCKVMDYKLWLT